MNYLKIASVALFIVAMVLFYVLGRSIYGTIDETNRIEQEEKRVIEKLKLIRSAMVGYQRTYGQYTSDWENLIHFVDSGLFYITERREFVKQLDYGAEQVTIEIDTIATIGVFDSLFAHIPNFQSSRLPYKPNSDVKFDIFADKIVKGGVEVDVFEVKDPKPVNPKRRAKNNERALRIGSRSEVTTSGNWE
jgi:hypothetical protein